MEETAGADERAPQSDGDNSCSTGAADDYGCDVISGTELCPGIDGAHGGQGDECHQPGHTQQTG